ncbi:MAG: zf-HC2 domain-containing protein [Clostridia bacterium]|nr:zf-HC2 domain-containing protein [Clostridia bacterium]
MANITCETVKDLLPLYLDDVLSTDSRKLAEEHLESCPECREYFNRLKASDIASRQKKAANDKTVIKKIRKKIRTKQFISGCAAALAVLGLAWGIFYYAAVRLFPVSYESSGIFVEDNILKTKTFYREAYILSSPDGSAAFVYLTATKYDLRRPEITNIEHINIFNLDEMEPAKQLDENGNIVAELGRPNALYYVPQKYAAKLEDTSYWDPYWEDGDEAKMLEKLDDLISASTLIWEAK